LQNQPDLDFLDILIRDGIKHGVVFQIKHFVYPATPPNHQIQSKQVIKRSSQTLTNTLPQKAVYLINEKSQLKWYA
jgi:hypothetical protein